MRKLDIGFIREKIAERGYKLLSTEYVGADNGLVMECSEGHIIELSFAKFNKGRRCKYCNKSRVWFKDIIRLFEKDNYLLLTKECDYINSKKTKLKYKCNNGHFGETSLAHWKNGIRCKICYIEQRTIKFEYVKKEIEKTGYMVLYEEQRYFNSRIKLKCMCDKGHVIYISWNSWKSGTRCKRCSLKKRDVKARLKYEFIKKEFENRGFALLSKSYSNAFDKLDYVCDKGHKCSIRWNDFQQHCGCSICSNIAHSVNFCGVNHPNWKGGISKEPYCQDWTNDLRGYVKERDNYKCLNPYCSSKRPDKLAVHHVDYNKKSCGPENLITICRSCNTKANSNRNWHEAWYKAILYRRYNYKY